MPVIAYAEDLSSWEDWQHDYRLGVILIRPPAEIARRIDALRAEYDPRSHAISPTHISLSDPLSSEMTPALRAEIGDILRAISPFELRFEKPQASTEHAGVYCPVSPQEPIDGLRNALHASSAFSGPAYERRNIPAHMTIAEFMSMEDSLRLSDELQTAAATGSFTCNRLSFMVPDENFRFHEVDTFPLGGSRHAVASP